MVKISGQRLIPNTLAPISEQLRTFSFFYLCCLIYFSLIVTGLVFQSTKAIQRVQKYIVILVYSLLALVLYNAVYYLATTERISFVVYQKFPASLMKPKDQIFLFSDNFFPMVGLIGLMFVFQPTAILFLGPARGSQQLREVNRVTLKRSWMISTFALLLLSAAGFIACINVELRSPETILDFFSEYEQQRLSWQRLAVSVPIFLVLFLSLPIFTKKVSMDLVYLKNWKRVLKKEENSLAEKLFDRSYNRQQEMSQKKEVLEQVQKKKMGYARVVGCCVIITSVWGVLVSAEVLLFVLSTVGVMSGFFFIFLLPAVMDIKSHFREDLQLQNRFNRKINEEQSRDRSSCRVIAKNFAVLIVGAMLLALSLYGVVVYFINNLVHFSWNTMFY